MQSSPLLNGLREAVLAVHAESHVPRYTNVLVGTCHALAVAALQMKRRHKLMLVEDTLDLSDLAYDCIGDLFARNEQGSLLRLKAYFGSYDLDRCSDEDLLIDLRRLVFSAVNQSLFRIYNTYDPSLGKILRNLKISVQALSIFTETEHLGEQCIAPTACDPLAHLSVMDLETLQSALARRTIGNERVPAILAILARYLREQSDFSRQVPLIRLALALRWLYSIKQLPPAGVSASGEMDHRIDVRSAVRSACVTTMQTLGVRYLRNERVSRVLLLEYMEAVENILLAEFDGTEGNSSLFQNLKVRIPGLTREEYVEVHRSRMEYLARHARALVVRQLKTV